jgi:hypothetical protein
MPKTTRLPAIQAVGKQFGMTEAPRKVSNELVAVA